MVVGVLFQVQAVVAELVTMLAVVAVVKVMVMVRVGVALDI